MAIEITLLALTLVAATLGAYYARIGAKSMKAYQRHAESDVYLYAGVADQHGHLSGQVEVCVGEYLTLGVTNLGGSTSDPSKLVITAGPDLDLTPEGSWVPYSRPVGTMPGGSKAWRIDVDALQPNEKRSLPRILVGGTPPASYIMRDYKVLVPSTVWINWAFYIGKRGANSARVEIILRPTT